MDKPVYNKGLSGEKPFWVDKPVNNKGLSGGKPFPRQNKWNITMLETILIAVVGTTIGIVVHSLNANVAHRQPFLTDKADF